MYSPGTTNSFFNKKLLRPASEHYALSASGKEKIILKTDEMKTRLFFPIPRGTQVAELPSSKIFITAFLIVITRVNFIIAVSNLVL